jgi:RND superfamily putative drug exporter
VVALTAAVAVLAALIAVFFSIKIGQSSVESLASSGPAYESLQTLRDGGVPQGALTPIEVLATTADAPAIADALGQVDGISHAFVSSAPDSNVDGRDRRGADARPGDRQLHQR